MLSIGEFSARSGLSAKALRSYARLGLLVPAAVDRSNGYRYYSLTQLDEASLVSLLRRADIPVAEIAAFLRDPSASVLESWEELAGAEFDRRRRALSAVRERLRLHSVDLAQPQAAWSEGGEVLHVVFGSASDVGRSRVSNEDGLVAANHLFAVADGMGGDGRGERASGLALRVLSGVFGSEPSADRLVAGVREANRAVWELADSGGDLAGMGTTLTAAAVVSDRAWSSVAVANVGDSRVYMLERDELVRVTRDHSVAEELVLAGSLTEERARTHPQRSVLTRVLGLGPDVEPDLFTLVPPVGARLLLCTDGLFNELTDPEIAEVLGRSGTPSEVAAGLVASANESGGRDNVSVVVVEFV